MYQVRQRSDGTRMVREVILRMVSPTHRPSDFARRGLSIVEGRGAAAPKGFWVRLGASAPRCVVIAIIIAVASGCKPSEPLKVQTIQTGRSLNSDNSVATHTTRFKPKDPMYVSVLTDGRGSGTIEVRWSYGGRVINRARKDVSYIEPAATDFRFQAADGFPAGDYTIEVFVDDKSIGTRSVKVE